jgi:competence ComEA-like helix-hairpin-helix protein
MTDPQSTSPIDVGPAARKPWDPYRTLVILLLPVVAWAWWSMRAGPGADDDRSGTLDDSTTASVDNDGAVVSEVPVYSKGSRNSAVTSAPAPSSAAGSAPPAPPARSTSRPSLQDTIDPNVAPWPELTVLPMIGPSKAQAIVAYREERLAAGAVDEFGRVFRCAEDLDQVRGIGPKTVERIRPFLRFDAEPASPPDES